MSKRVPKYRLHKATGQAVVTLNGKDYYLGKHGTKASHERYNQLTQQWTASNGRRVIEPHASLTMDELFVAYLRDLANRGKPLHSEERIAIRIARELYGTSKASDFGPRKLKMIQERMVKTKGRISGKLLSRQVVNGGMRAIRRVFRWAVSSEFVHPDVWGALSAVETLREGEMGVNECRKIDPVAIEDVQAIQPYVPNQVWDVIQILLLTAARPSEIIKMKAGEIDTTENDAWAYRPEKHKTAYLGKKRTIMFGPKAQQILTPYLEIREDDELLFNPSKAPSRFNIKGYEKDNSNVRNGHYSQTGIWQQITRACELAGIKRWFPYQLRHTAATAIRAEKDLDVARAVLGHGSTLTTLLYADADETKQREIMARIG